MFRRFNFEEDIYCSLDCVPMTVRRKLDRIGLKVGLAQWQALGQGERLAACHLPADQPEECEAIRTFIIEAVKRVSGVEPKELPAVQRLTAEPPREVPSSLVADARSTGVALTQEMWDSARRRPTLRSDQARWPIKKRQAWYRIAGIVQRCRHRFIQRVKLSANRKRIHSAKA